LSEIHITPPRDPEELNVQRPQNWPWRVATKLNELWNWIVDMLSGFTAGSVIFSDGTILDEDNDNFFWDDTNKRLGIGTKTPTTPLNIYTDNALTTGSIFLQQDGAGDVSTRFSIVGAVNWAFGIDNSDSDKFKIESSASLGAATAELTLMTNGRVGVNTTSPDTALQVVGTGKFGEDTTNFAEFESDGTLKFNGTATVWDDYVVPLGPNNWRGTSNNPTLTQLFTDGSGSQGVYASVFSDGDEAIVTVQLPHGYKEGSDIRPHIHFMCTSDVDPSDNFGIEFEYTWTNIGSDFPANSTLETNDIPTGVDTDNMHQLANITAAAIDGTGKGISSVLLCRIKRVAASGDNYAGGVAIMDFDIHYEVDTIGSRLIVTK